MKRWADEVFEPEPRRELKWPAKTVILALEPIVFPERIARIERAVAARIQSVVVVVESLVDPHNVAAILRTCDGLGVGEVHAIETAAHVLMTNRVTKGCEKWMHLRRHATAKACAEELHRRGFALMVADMRADRTMDEVAALPRVALAMGNEHEGASAALRAEADGTFCIPMRGMVESFNVSVAAAIALSTVTRARHGDLGSDEAEELKARWLMETVREPELVVDRYVRERAAK